MVEFQSLQRECFGNGLGFKNLRFKFDETQTFVWFIIRSVSAFAWRNETIDVLEYKDWQKP